MTLTEGIPPATAFPSVVALRATHTALLQQRREIGMNEATLAAAAEFIQRGQVTGAVIDDDEERADVQSLLNFWSNVLYRAGQEPPDATLDEFDAALAPELDDSLCPYLGLDAFREEYQSIFFGRRELVDQIVAQLAQKRLLTVVGPSGSGKSSLVRAGIIPALKQGALPDSESWRYLPPFVPGVDPFAALTRALWAEGVAADQIIDILRHDAESMVALSDSLGTIMLVIDQFEELFTLCDDPATREAFVAGLLALVRQPSAQHRVILTLRSDFETFVARMPALQQVVADGRVQATPLSAAELREAIEHPAAQVGLKFENGVVERLLQDILGEPAALPLLQFTLLKLWEGRERNRVTLATYERIGGGRAALARSADAFYHSLIPEDQITARRILLRLVRPGSGLEVTSSRVRRSALNAGGEDPGRVARVLDRLLAARLLRCTPGERTADDQIEVAHEALVRNWPTLVDWLEEERTAIATRRKLEARATEWVRMGRGSGGLLDEVALQDAERWLRSSEASTLGYNDDLAALVVASRAALVEAEQQQVAQEVALVRAQAEAEAERLRAEEQVRSAKQLRVQRIVLASLLGLALVAIWLAFDASNKASSAATDAQNQKALAEQQLMVADAQRVAFQALREAPSAPETALLLAYEAVQHNSNLVTEQALRDVFDQVPWRATTLLPVGKERVRVASFSPDGQHILTVSHDQPPQVWDLSGKQLFVLNKHVGEVTDAIWSSDGQRIVTVGADKMGYVWDANGTVQAAFGPFNDLPDVVAIDSAGKTIASAEKNGAISLWSITGAPLASGFGHKAKVKMITFSPDSHMLLTASEDSSARLWDLKGKEIATFAHDKTVNSAIFNKEGKRVLTASDDGTVRLWQLDGSFIAFNAHTDKVTTAIFSHDEQRILTGSEDHTARVWDLSGSPLVTLAGHNDDVAKVAFSPDDQLILTASDDNSALLWDRTGNLLAIFNSHTDDITEASFSPDGGSVLTASEDGTARLWQLEPQSFATHTNDADVAWSNLYSPDGKSILAIHGDFTAHLLDTNGVIQRTYRSHTDTVTLAIFSPDGKYVLTGSDDMSARLWPTNSETAQATLKGHDAAITALAFSPDGAHIATGDAKGGVRLWDARGKLMNVLQSHTDAVLSLAFSPDNSMLLSASRDGNARLWNLQGQHLQDFAGRAGGIWNAAWSPDSKLIATILGSNEAMIWNLDGSQHGELKGHADDISSVVFSPDGQFVLTASDDNSARLWDPQGALKFALVGHSGPVREAIFSPSGTYILTSSDDGTTRLWDHAGRQKAIFTGIVVSLDKHIFNPDETRLLATTGGSDIHQYVINIDQLLHDAACRIGRNIMPSERERFGMSWQPTFDAATRQCSANVATGSPDNPTR